MSQNPTHTSQAAIHKRPSGNRKVAVAPFHPSWVLIGFFAVLIGMGTLVLALPISTSGGGRASILDAFFTSVSAASGTGLSVQDTATFWSPFGQRAILGLVSIGGLGALVGSTMFLIVIARRINKEERHPFKELMRVDSLGGMILLAFGITLFVLIVEAIGTYLLAWQLSKSMPWNEALWMGIFHSSSAFNNAGFEIMGMSQRLPDTSIQIILAVLSLLGALGFLVFIDIVRGIFRRPLALDTKVVLLTFVVLLIAGIGMILITEWGNIRTLGDMSISQKLVSAFFHSATARTTGMQTVDLSAFAQPTLLLLAALMFIGGASGSTGGGIKVNTFAVLIATTWSFVRGKKDVTAFGTVVQEEQVHRALAIAFISIIVVFAFTISLSVTEGRGLLDQIFETVSAFSTTGFTTGATATFSTAGKLIIILAMFIGRVGPLTLAFAISQRHKPTRETYTMEAINLG